MDSPVPVSYLLAVKDLDESLRKCYFNEFSANGAKHVVLSATMLPMIMESPQLAGTLLNEVSDAGLSFLDAHAPYGPHWDLNSIYEEARDALLVRQKLAIAIAASMGVKTMTIHIGSDHHCPEVPFETHFSRACSMLEELLKEAEKHDLVLAVENGWTRTASLDTMLAIKEKFPTDHLGFCFDSGHANIMDNGQLYTAGEAYNRWNAIGVKTPPWEDTAEKLEKMLPHIVNCHLHDNMGDSDQHTIPGSGNVKWDVVTAALRRAPRLQVIQCEVLFFRNNLSVRETVGSMNKLFD